MNITLRQLRIFEATARLGRLTAAAEEQALSQSAASQALKELESALSYRLFIRSGRELVLTESALDILPRVRVVLANVASLKAPSSKGISGPLRIAASVTVASYLFPPLMAEFLARYPAVEPDLQIANTQHVLTQLEKSQAQIGLIEGPVLHPQLQIRHWREDRLEVFCSHSHPLAEAGTLNAEQMRQQRWILREQGSGTRAVFDQAIQQANIDVQMIMALNRQEAIKQSVKAGLGIGCLSQLAVAEEQRRGELVVLQTPLDLTRRLSVVVHPESRTNPLIEAFMDFLGL